MPNSPDIAAIARLVGDPTRGRILTALMDGRAHTATELAMAGAVTPSTTSSHLARLRRAGLITEVRQGRHRYFRLAGPDVAAAIESLMRIAPRSVARQITTGPDSAELRHARTCYDHLAGEVAVHFLERLRAGHLVGGTDDEMELTAKGRAWCGRRGIDLSSLAESRRRLCRPCLDWSERRTHLAGALGSAVLQRLVAIRYARMIRGTRRVVLSPQGESFLRHPAG
ncbi:MAG: helix-turn-helix transcriptional regulator [Gemmatimonadota bacterium]